MNYNQLWSSYQKALKRIDDLEAKIKKLTPRGPHKTTGFKPLKKKGAK